MLVNPTARTIEALASLEHDRDFTEVMQWLQASLERTQEACTEEMNTDMLRQHQGAAQTLNELKRTAEHARRTLETLRS